METHQPMWMETQIGAAFLGTSTLNRSFVFVIEFGDPRSLEHAAAVGKGKYSIIVRIEPEEVLAISSAMAPAIPSHVFAEELAHQTALLAMEKDFPNGIEPSLSVRQISQIPAQFEKRKPNVWVNGNSAWLVPKFCDH